MGGIVDESVAGRPAAPLGPLIGRYSGYQQSAVGPACHRGLPSPYLTMIFTLDEPLTVAEHPDPAQPAGCYLTLAGGLHTRPALITHDGWQSGIQLALSPLAARAVLGVPAGELAGIDVEGADVLGPAAGRIQRRLQAAAGWPERFAILDELLLARIAGLTPKAAARVVRFDRSRRLLQRRAAAGGRLDLAELAATCGYYDQAHLDREFRALAGCPPTAWLAQEFRFFQASVPAHGAG